MKFYQGWFLAAMIAFPLVTIGHIFIDTQLGFMVPIMLITLAIYFKLDEMSIGT